MSKFKVGDRVRCIDNEGQEGELEIGKEYTVNFVSANGIAIRHGAAFWDYYDRRFELAESEPEQPKEEPTVLERVTSKIERSTLIYNYLDTKDSFERAMAAYNDACQAIRDNVKDGEKFVYTRYGEGYIVQRDAAGFTVDKIDMV